MAQYRRRLLTLSANNRGLMILYIDFLHRTMIIISSKKKECVFMENATMPFILLWIFMYLRFILIWERNSLTQAISQ